MTAVEIRLPELSGGSEQEQLRRIQSYLYTLAQQLQFAFDTVTREQTQAAAAREVQPESRGEVTKFAAVKALILKSAQITEHFQEAVEKKLSGLYVAQSQFGSFRQETEAAITANSQSIQQKFTQLQQLEAAVAGLESAVREVSATIRTGLLAETPEGGSIEIRASEKGFAIRNDAADLPDPATVCEPLVKGESARTARSGSGMGLAIVRQIMQLHGFRFAVKAADGKFTAKIKI